jgi:hypothetical protein
LIGSQSGAPASYLFYSFVVTAKINGGNPYAILKFLFAEVPKAKTVDEYDRLADVILSSFKELSI